MQNNKNKTGQNKMINIFVYTHDKYKPKAIDATDGKTITLEDGEAASEIYNLIFSKIIDNSENNYIVKDINVLEVLSHLHQDYDKACIYLNSRFIYGSRWGKFKKQDKEDFNKAIQYAIKSILTESRSKRC